MKKIVNSVSKLRVHRGFIQSLKLWLNLCSFRWLNPSLSLVINLSPSRLKMPNTELGMDRIIFYQINFKDIKTGCLNIKVKFAPFIYRSWEKTIWVHQSCKKILWYFLYSERYISGIQRGLTQLNKMEFHYF